jgi:uncharacterized protein YbjQ (UPF0145 family)
VRSSASAVLADTAIAVAANAVVALRITGEEYGNTIRNLYPVYTLQNGGTRDRSIQYKKGWRVEPV